MNACRVRKKSTKVSLKPIIRTFLTKGGSNPTPFY